MYDGEFSFSLCLKKKARAREARECRRALISGTHKVMLGLVADHLGIELAQAEEFILDDRNVSMEFLVYLHMSPK